MTKIDRIKFRFNAMREPLAAMSKSKGIEPVLASAFEAQAATWQHALDIINEEDQKPEPAKALPKLDAKEK
jgi:hypothetical protein